MEITVIETQKSNLPICLQLMYCYITLRSTGILIPSCVTFTLDREASVLLDFYTRFYKKA
jgi:hypothetical protein